MKIRKKTSFMLLAASTAAVVGVAAVSFAAWTGSNTDLLANAATGSAYLFGFKQVDDADHKAHAELDKDLVPYNQENGYDTDTCATIATLELPTYEVVGAYTINVTLGDITKENVAYTLPDGTAFYVTDDATATAYTPGAEGWLEITADTTTVSATFSYDTTEVTQGVVENKKLKFALVSENSADMNLTVHFNVTLVNDVQ